MIKKICFAVLILTFLLLIHRCFHAAFAEPIKDKYILAAALEGGSGGGHAFSSMVDVIKKVLRLVEKKGE